MAENFELKGARELGILLQQFPDKVALTVRRTGLRTAGARLRTLIRNAAPRGPTGNLRKAINSKQLRNGAVVVGLRERFYYKTLEFGRKGGPPLHPFFARVIESNKYAIGDLLIKSTKDALALESGKLYARSRAISGGR